MRQVLQASRSRRPTDPSCRAVSTPQQMLFVESPRLFATARAATPTPCMWLLYSAGDPTRGIHLEVDASCIARSRKRVKDDLPLRKDRLSIDNYDTV